MTFSYAHLSLRMSSVEVKWCPLEVKWWGLRASADLDPDPSSITWGVPYSASQAFLENGLPAASH